MKIIIPGNKKVISKKKYFKCNECDCVFSAEKGEYKSVQQYNAIYYYLGCPMARCTGTGYELPETERDTYLEITESGD